MKDTYTIAQDFSYGDYLNFSLYQLPRLRMMRRLFIYFIALGILGQLSSFLGPAHKFTFSWGFFYIPVASLSVFFLLFYPLAALYVIRVKPHLFRGITYRFTHWGMERIGATTEATVPWRDFRNLKETKSFYLLFVKETVKENKVDNIHVIQKRMFANTADAQEFQVFLDQNVPL